MMTSPVVHAQARAWTQIDHRLVSLKVSQAAKGFHEKHQQRRRGCIRVNTGTDLAALVKLYIEEASELAEMHLAIYKEVWEKQRKPRTPDFLRTVLNQGLMPVIEARVGAAKFDLENTARRTRCPFSLVPFLQKLTLDADRIKSEWRTRIEIEARELDLERAKGAVPIVRPQAVRDGPGRTQPEQEADSSASLPGKSAKQRRTKKHDLSQYLDGASLTNRQYQCASLRFEYGLPVSQIARELGLHRKTVDEHIQSAQAKMQSSGQYERTRDSSNGALLVCVYLKAHDLFRAEAKSSGLPVTREAFSQSN